MKSIREMIRAAAQPRQRSAGVEDQMAARPSTGAAPLEGSTDPCAVESSQEGKPTRARIVSRGSGYIPPPKSRR
jgi:hypothetical protein